MTALYAIWRYDLFPYYLGGEVAQVLDSGRIKAKGYGGMIFAPVKLLPAPAGRALMERLNALDREHSKAEKAFKETWRAKVDALIQKVGE